jgi:hypothetical protein
VVSKKSLKVNPVNNKISNIDIEWKKISLHSETKDRHNRLVLFYVCCLPNLNLECLEFCDCSDSVAVRQNKNEKSIYEMWEATT